jgi:hypothetical protein
MYCTPVSGAGQKTREPSRKKSGKNQLESILDQNGIHITVGFSQEKIFILKV